MTKTNLARLIILILVFLFFVLYFMQASGYNEYAKNRENMLTPEQIKEYEEDIAAGKDVTIKDYVNKDKVNYENNISKLGLDLSYLIENAFNKGMNAFFNMLNEAISSWLILVLCYYISRSDNNSVLFLVKNLKWDNESKNMKFFSLDNLPENQNDPDLIERYKVKVKNKS